MVLVQPLLKNRHSLFHTLFERRQEYKLKITTVIVRKPHICDTLNNIEIMFANDGHLCYPMATDEIAVLCDHALAKLNFCHGHGWGAISVVTIVLGKKSLNSYRV